MGQVARLFAFLCWTLSASVYVSGKQPAYLEQGFFFDFNPAGTSIPIPVTTQCDTIHISWERGQATGPNPTAPYFLSIYTSAFIVPFVVAAGSGTSFDFPVPFYPGTQYQICMFDTNGVTGGCQDIYTVIANTSSSFHPTCNNVTFPAGAMDVKAAVSTGSFSQYGWIDQCQDIYITPQNGTPPYTLTIAPTLHPPLNITSDSMDTIDWKVSLTWGFSFFISLVDSQGNRWSQGPLHSGGNGPTDCLDLNAGGKTVASSVAVGSGVGGLVLGLVVGGLAAFLCYRRHSHRKTNFARHSNNSNTQLNSRYDDYPSADAIGLEHGGVSLALSNSHSAREATSSSRRTATTTTTGSLGQNSSYHIEPFVLPSERPAPHIHTHSLSDPSSPLLFPPGAATSATLSPRASPSAHQREGSNPATPSDARPSGSHVYVVHHDAGRPPVTVYTDSGTEVVELPPRYMDDRAPPHQPTRQPGAVPRKALRTGQSESS